MKKQLSLIIASLITTITSLVGSSITESVDVNYYKFIIDNQSIQWVEIDNVLGHHQFGSHMIPPGQIYSELCPKDTLLELIKEMWEPFGCKFIIQLNAAMATVGNKPYFTNLTNEQENMNATLELCTKSSCDTQLNKYPEYEGYIILTILHQERYPHPQECTL